MATNSTDAEEGATNSSTFQFVNLSGSGQDADQETKTLIRKHVMKDIGKARRRKKGPQQFVFDVQVPSDTDEPTANLPASEMHGQSTGRSEIFDRDIVLANALISSHANISPISVPIPRSELKRFDGVVPSPVTMLGAGRVDPFATYPIKMTPRLRGLVDHRQFQLFHIHDHQVKTASH